MKKKTIDYDRIEFGFNESPEYKETSVYGDFVSMNPENDKRLMVFKRTSEEKEVLVIANFDTVSKKYVLEYDVKKIILSNAKDVELSGNELALAPFEVVIMDLVKGD